MDDAMLTRRAMTAYFREGTRNGCTLDQPASTSGPVHSDGECFIELHNARGTLALYRVLGDGLSPRLRQVPQEDWPERFRADA